MYVGIMSVHAKVAIRVLQVMKLYHTLTLTTDIKSPLREIEGFNQYICLPKFHKNPMLLEYCYNF